MGARRGSLSARRQLAQSWPVSPSSPSSSIRSARLADRRRGNSHRYVTGAEAPLRSTSDTRSGPLRPEWALLNEVGTERENDRVGPIGRPELRDEGLHGLLDGVLGEDHRPSDLLVRVPLGEVLEELQLAGAQGVLRRSLRGPFRCGGRELGPTVEAARKRPRDRLLARSTAAGRLGERARLPR